MTNRTSALSTPMPNAFVATMTSCAPAMNASWIFVRSGAFIPAVVEHRADAGVGQVLGDLLGVAARRDVDDAGLGGVLHALDQHARLRGLVGAPLDRERDVRPIEPPHDDAVIFHAEPLDDVVAD